MTKQLEPLALSEYADAYMRGVFCGDTRYRTRRKLWVSYAKTGLRLGSSYSRGGIGIGRSAEQAECHLDEAIPFISELDGKTAEITL